MPAAGVVLLVTVVAIVLVLVFFLVSTIVALRQITNGPRRGDRLGRRDHREERPRRGGRRDDQPAPRRGRRPARGPARQEGRDAGRRRPRRRPLPRRRRGRVPQLPGEHRDHRAADLRGLHEGHADAGPPRPRGADRRREPDRRRGPAQRDRRQPRGPLAVPRGPPDAPRAAQRSPVIGTDSPVQYEPSDSPACAGAPGHDAATPPRDGAQRPEGEPGADPGPFEYERATSVDGAIASLQRLGPDARIIAGGHSLLPMMKLRLANPEHLIDINDLDGARLHPRGGRRDPDRRADAPRRPAQVRAARAALPGLPRRRGGHRRPGRPQPRDDRRLAVPGRRGRGPQRGVLGGEGERRDPQRRGRARRRDERRSTSARS